jgi:cysteine-rich repeat protein
VLSQCSPQCGDGLLAPGVEQCDDGNSIDHDGCSSSCALEEYFQCNTVPEPSTCLLTTLNLTPTSLLKTDDKNEIVLTVKIEPEGLVPYETADWLQAFQNAHPLLAPGWASYDKANNRLRIGFEYSESLQGQALSFNTDFSAASSVFSVPPISLALP